MWVLNKVHLVIGVAMSSVPGLSSLLKVMYASFVGEVSNTAKIN